MSKKLRFSLLLFFVYGAVTGQVPSDCSVPSVLRTAYDRDVKGLVIKRMQTLNSDDQYLVTIPQAWQDSILEGMAAIFNLAESLPTADSVFNRYCVHDGAFSPAVYGFIIGVDPNSTYAQAWAAGQTLSGDPVLDTLLVRHGFTLTSYISFGAGVFYTDQLINLFALADSIVNNVPGIQYAEPDFLVGGAGHIEYTTDAADNRFYNFRYEWNDCFDGCDNYYSWQFSVGTDCSVTFLGTDQGGFFGIEPLPAPTNCMLTTPTREPTGVVDIRLFPNPASTAITWENAPQEGGWLLLNAHGQILRRGDWQTTNLDASQLPGGLYGLRWYGADGQTKAAKTWVKQ